MNESRIVSLQTTVSVAWVTAGHQLAAGVAGEVCVGLTAR